MTLFGRKALTMIQGAKGEPDSPEMDPFASIEPQMAPAAASAPAVSLEAVLSSDVRIAWDESVSIVEALCVAVQGNVLRSIPSAKEIFLTGSGTLAVRSGAGEPDPVEAGRRLLELLGKGTVPAPLRLFASQAVRDGQHGSIVEFQQGLNYFAKPGGRERIVAVYERCSQELAAMPFPSESEQARPGKALDKAKASDKSDKKDTRWHLGREALLAAGAIVVTVLVVAAGYFAWLELAKPSADAEPGPEVQAEAAAPTTKPTARLGRSGARTATAGAPAARLSGAATVAAGSARASSPVAPGGGPADLEIAGRPPAPASLPEVADSGSSSVPAGGAAAASAVPLFVQETALEPVDLDRVYSAADAGVVPATLVREQLLPPAMGVLEGVAPLQLELFVSAEGAVERARFVVPPRRMADMMLLSSAKMWTFNPALKDGRPVRSRVVLSWNVAP